jgi:hypothetical protein
VEEGVARRKLKCSADALDLSFGRGASDGMLFGAIDETASGGGHVAFWDVESGSLTCTVPQPRGHVSCLHCDRAGTSVLVGAADGTVRQLSSADGREIFRFKSAMSDVNLVSLSCGETYVQVS